MPQCETQSPDLFCKHCVGDGLEAECDSAASSLQCMKSVEAGCLKWCRARANKLKVAVMMFNPETVNCQPMYNETCVFKWRAPEIQKGFPADKEVVMAPPLVMLCPCDSLTLNKISMLAGILQTDVVHSSIC